ncbi:hypothetical protein [Terrabacter sp. C0L_2]|uniref:hypothetical protein n=1 Tax=Terrabacter sp. C0L_2 TaxID=3108389 RepID=UPI002ED631F3|nr:hypothetical protein U5C87_08760 [Terrabacter sp. C0L_2]
MPSARVSRENLVRGVAVALITGVVTLAAACSDEDTVDTIPPPWPTRTTKPDGPPQPPTSSTTIPTSTVSVAGTT